MSMTTTNPADLRMSAELKLTSNGDNAKTAKVTLVARTGDAIDSPWFGRFVHDFAGMSAKPRIPIDYAHDPEDSIGYLNKFETGSGDLVCSGAIVLVGHEVNEVVQKMQAGVPYEASIEFGDDFVMEYVPEGFSVTVNGRDIAGPLTVIRQWTLKAVAICKFGLDGGTSAELQMSQQNTSDGDGKVFRVRMSKHRRGESQMNENEKAVEAEKVEATEDKKLSETPAEVPATVEAEPQVEAEKVVEASETAEDKVKVDEEVAVAAAMSVPVALVKAVDPREEFKQFVATFGDKAADYYAQGLSMSDATKEYVKYLKADNDKMKTRLAATRGAEAPVRFSDGATRDGKKGGLESLIRRK